MGEEATDNNPLQKKQRKKRKNFLKSAKKYAKKGQMGRGTQIPQDLFDYFVKILETIKQGIEDPDERHALVNNVLERTKGEELNIVGNQLGCRLIELLLPYASPEDLERYMDTLSPDLRRLCSDNFTSHIIETMLRVSCERATEHLQILDQLDDEVPKKKRKKDLSKYTDEHITSCHEFTLKIWEKPKVNMFVEKVGNPSIPPHATEMKYKFVPDEYKEIVKEFANRLSAWPQFKDLPYKNITSALLQVLLYAVKNTDKNLTKTLIKRLLNESFAPDDWVPTTGDDEKKDKIDVDSEESKEEKKNEGSLPPVFENESAVRLLEAALFVSKKKTYTQIYARCFINRLGQLATRKMLNFTVQRLIDNCHIKEEFEPMFDELASKYDAILACGNTGVLVARPAKVVSSLLELSADELLYILCDTKGCHVADSFCKGQFVGVKARDKLIWKLKVGVQMTSSACFLLKTS
ncbi:jg21775 [Pararge aegeria aegeria]|uniref:Jg21775 protein n=1 Tax=Pararge aegeria aegeria TaxID=348720 RepID=A0A8S4R0Y2_9NEOP|nr:jg21775 [Pararge aegeria aegeria]